MISLTRLDGSEFVLNAAQIVTVEQAGNTVLQLSTGTSMIVQESAATVVERVALVWVPEAST